MCSVTQWMERTESGDDNDDDWHARSEKNANETEPNSFRLNVSQLNACITSDS